MDYEQLKNIFQNHKKELFFSLASITVFFSLIFVFFFHNQTSYPEGKQGDNQSAFPNFGNLLGPPDQATNFDQKGEKKNGVTDQPPGEDGKNGEKYIEGLIEVWNKPVAGYAVDSKHILTFVDSQTGLIYEKNLLEPKSQARQVTATSSLYSLSNIQRAYFLGDQKEGAMKKVLFQYLDQNQNTKSLLATLPTPDNGPKKLVDPQDLPEQITKVAVSEDNTKLIFLVAKETKAKGEKDVFADLYSLENVYSAPTKIFTSPLTAWNLFLENNGNIYLSEIDTAFEVNNLYKLKIKNKDNYLENTLEKLYGDHTGLSFLFQQNNLLISANTGSGIKTYLNNLFFNKKFKDRDLKELPFKTLAKKCAFGEKILVSAVPKDIKNYNKFLPDSWYQGTENFSDNLYYLDPEGNFQIHFLYNLGNQKPTDFDLLSLKVTTQNSHLVMINKNDRSLWTLKIKNLVAGQPQN